MRTHVFPLLATAIFEAGLLAAIPIFAIALGTRIINGLQDARLRWTPTIELDAFATGAAAGAKPIVSIAVAGAVLASAYSHLSGDQRGKIASVEKTVFATVDSGISWLGATIAVGAISAS